MLVLGCSITKRTDAGSLPAWQRYDGPAWRVLRKRLTPEEIESHVLVLSARHGLIPAHAQIKHYDQRMTFERAVELRDDTSEALRAHLNGTATTLLLVLGKDYLMAVEGRILEDARVEVEPGYIGLKLQRVALWADQLAETQATAAAKGTLFYMPDWDDRVDPHFDFAADTWSGPTPAERGDKYAHELVSDPPPYDGMLVSLAQIKKKKGVLKSGAGTFSPERSVRQQLRLPDSMRLMGDCGAFSYINKPQPPYTPEEAVALYETLGFDVAASVDHVVFPGMTRLDDSEQRVELTLEQLQKRVEITTSNAERFFREAKETAAQFTPMGVIQALSVKQFGDLFVEYVDMGYEYVALGGLVPKRTEEIVRILKEINRRRQSAGRTKDVRLHLFGVMRQALLPSLATLGVTSFDSASYLRKAWLRSGKNYLSMDESWYAAIRIPFRNNPRVESGLRSSTELKRLEEAALKALINYERGTIRSDQAVSIVLEYDRLLTRKTDDGDRLEEAYTRTLEEKPWKNCPCPFCKAIGIHIVIFRGVNRNRRRGFHNLWLFKRQLEHNQAT